MRKSVKKYLIAFELMWTKATDYRFDFIFEFICSFIPIVALLFLWKAIYFNNTNVGSYDVYSMFTYIILARFIGMIITPGFFFDVTEEIQEGTLSNYIVKPINYIRYWFAKELGNKSRNFIIGLIPIIFIICMYREYFSIQCGIGNFILFMVSFIFSYIIYFNITMFVSFFSFWFYEISNWFYTISFMTEFLSGTLIPIDLLPAYLQNILEWLPFKYLVFFPVSILTDSTSYDAITSGLIIQGLWVIVSYICIKFLWSIGRKKYDAYGG
ncbi:ABC transporter permease [Clostridium disporicum]|uniref:ABC transporter permease n=1 Tax=Clostridium disporicum TaxID=84024 RepID=A0A174ERS1_9CLOT|nr:ABC-2 family transporter protein [Clostridium disporicum]CUO40842.1 ABC transporter permease [Clostridium disporicum]